MSQSNRTVSKPTGAKGKIQLARWRYLVLLVGLLILPGILVWHIAGLQVMPNEDRGFEFLQSQSVARTVRVESIPAYRGVITDRRGEPLAVSSPVVSLWVNPQVIDLNGRAGDVAALEKQLDFSPGQLKQKLRRYSNKEFMYLARHLSPEQADEIIRLEIPGIYSQVEYKRFYPAGEVTAQLVGFTDIDDQGQEGLELAYNQVLTGVPGAKKVLKDLKGRVIKDISLVRAEKPGENLALSIDLRLQYAAYKELKAAIQKNRAHSGSVVVLDVKTGEVLAMVNQPSYNPNDRGQLSSEALRNRAVTDLVEPGSLMKPLAVVAALESGRYTTETRINTSPGYITLGRKTFYDHRDYGVLDIATILKKSSQVGTIKMAMDLDPDHIRDVYWRVGLGQSPGTGFPGESPGSLPEHQNWRAVERANFAFGMGLSATALQLAQAYSVFANDGKKSMVSLLKVNEPMPSEQVIDPAISRNIREVLKHVTEEGGTATRASIEGYQVSGKTGTVHKVGANGYEKNRYVSLFAGMVPADNPRLVTVVIVNDPRQEGYYGGLVAAPVFANVVKQALRLMDIPPARVGDRESSVAQGLPHASGGDS